MHWDFCPFLWLYCLSFCILWIDCTFCLFISFDCTVCLFASFDCTFCIFASFDYTVCLFAMKKKMFIWFVVIASLASPCAESVDWTQCIWDSKCTGLAFIKWSEQRLWHVRSSEPSGIRIDRICMLYDGHLTLLSLRPVCKESYWLGRLQTGQVICWFCAFEYACSGSGM